MATLGTTDVHYAAVGQEEEAETTKEGLNYSDRNLYNAAQAAPPPESNDGIDEVRDPAAALRAAANLDGKDYATGTNILVGGGDAGGAANAASSGPATTGTVNRVVDDTMQLADRSEWSDIIDNYRPNNESSGGTAPPDSGGAGNGDDDSRTPGPQPEPDGGDPRNPPDRGRGSAGGGSLKTVALAVGGAGIVGVIAYFLMGGL